MKAKLIKTSRGKYLLLEPSKDIKEGWKPSLLGSLSLKNCQAIERGYDLDELACEEIRIDISVVKHIDEKLKENSSPCVPLNEGGCVGSNLYNQVKGFEKGFQKALEIIGDNKFTEEDIVNAMNRVWDWCEDDKDEDCSSMTELRNKHFQSLQQTEWDVEIEMEMKFIGQCGCPCHSNTGIMHVMACCNPQTVEFPTKDEDGCLILRRI